METEIYFLLHSLELCKILRIFAYLAYGIALCMEDEDYLLRVSKTLYTKDRATFSGIVLRVERDIRTAISVCWTRGTVICSFRFLHPVLTNRPIPNF